jgi:hypothetical protein
MSKLPQWATAQRRQHLVDLFDRCGGYCIFGDAGCRIDEHHYELSIEGIIDSWKAEDRERRAYEWKLEQRQIIDGTYGQYGTTFDPVARDVYVNSRPAYYLVGMGVNPFTYQRVALVRIPSTFVHLFVDVGSAVKSVQGVSKNAKRKAVRHGKIRQGALMAEIDQLCKAAVADWWSVR